MAELKTKVSKASVTEFIRKVQSDDRRKDALALLKLFTEVTGERPKLWGTSIIGYGSYHYKSERSSQEGDWPLTGFSPRKQNLTIYIMSGFGDQTELLKKLGKYKKSVGCLYVNKLADIDQKVLKQIIKKSFTEMKKKYKA